MSVLPIVDRELRVAARRKGTYRLRYWSALAMLAIWLVLLASTNHGPTARLGHYLLVCLGVLALVMSMFAGVFLTSDSLSEEKREGTLGLLFLTNLKGHDVVLGKMAAHSLHAFFGLLAMLPILGLTLLMGGVTGLEFARVSLAFVATLCFSLGLGMGVSAVCRDARQAIGGTFMLMLIFAGICPAIWWIYRMLFTSTSWQDCLLLPSPVATYIFGMDDVYRSGNAPVIFWSSVGTLFALGLGAVFLATVVLPRCWQERSRVTPAKKRSSGPTARRADFTDLELLLRYEPASWLALRDASPRRSVRRMLLILLPFWLCALAISLTSKWWREGFMIALFAAYAMHLSVKTLMAVEASRRMNEDRRSGAWELLLVTPMTVKSILAGQKKALWRHFWPAILVLWLVNFTMLAATQVWHSHLGMMHEDRLMFGQMFTGGAIVLLFDFFALGWVGMWRGLKARQHHRAVLVALGQIMGAPLLAAFLLIAMQPNFGPGISGPMIALALWFGMGMGLDVVSSIVARRQLLNEFRTAVLAGG